MSEPVDDKHKEQKLELTLGRIESVLKEMRADGSLFVSSYESLVRRFLATVLDKSVYKLSFSDLRERFLSLNLVTREAPVEADEFFRWFCDHVLWLSRLPGSTLSELYDQASKDLATIKSNLQKCEEGKSSVRAREPKTEHDALDEKFFHYYHNKNVEARGEIVDVLAEQIRDKALHSARRHMRSSLDVHVPWSFRLFPDLFDPDEFSEFQHKFSHLPLRELNRIECAYRDGPAEFDRILAEYFATYDPPGELLALCTGHHRLAARKDVIIPALDAFQGGQYALFCSAAVLQVEGMFEDCCLELDVRPDSLQRQSIAPKLDTLNRSKAGTPSYPYYAYRFPRLRNTLAHGRVLDATTVRRSAKLLLLDLVDVADHVAKAPSHNNLMITFLRTASPQRSVDVIKFGTLVVNCVACPVEFYGLQAAYQNFMVSLADGEEVWALLHKIGDTHDPFFIANAYSFARLLKKRDISPARCTALLRTLGEQNEEAPYERTTFWDQLNTIAKP